MTPDPALDSYQAVLHFLRLSLAQLQHQLAISEKNKEPYSERVGRMRMLEELIKEQLPDGNTQNPRPATRETR